MSEYKRPLPQISDYTRPFWEAAKKGELLLQRCRKCGAFIWYPRPSCPECGSLDTEWVPSKGLGTVYSFTVIRRVVANSPDFQRDIPFTVAEVDLDEGVRVYGRLDGVKPEEVKTGMRVKVCFEDATNEISLYKFIPLK
ncbi:MAG: Zn-ribbon domain-containing OB-fold protein [Candidatus Caldarchaeum sp.]|nr:Zn-ribbon domain-containing OB-fold protein [Candidatus Caldarchaeum sp.]MDW7977718.1 Zn-ribbon domain-containing OB-fold protein [Candidatus Caldarchaeum sp.]